MEEEVGGEPLGLGRIHAANRIADQETAGRGLIVMVQYSKYNLRSGLDREENVHIASKAQILSSLPYVEADLRLALAALACVELQNLILHFQPRQPLTHRLLV